MSEADRRGAGPDGVALIDKPAGITSHDAVAIVRRALGTRKVGHAGTLDPMATGLLVMGIGRATRLLRFFGDLPKEYEGTMRLGLETTTLDAEGEVTSERAVDVTDDAIDAAMAAKLGASAQRPPAFSAVKVGGRTLHEAARKGEHLEAPARIVRVDRFERTRRAGVDVGFVCVGERRHVRAGARRRCRRGARMRRAPDGAPPHRDRTVLGRRRGGRPTTRASRCRWSARVAHLPRCELIAEEAIAASHGRILGPAAIEGPYGVYDPDGRLIGVYRDDGGKARPLVILAPA